MEKFEIITDYYVEGENLYNFKDLYIDKGITVFTGCNGIGKTTLLEIIKNKLEETDTPFIMYDNLHDGDTNNLYKVHSAELFALLLQSSEGENIMNNLGIFTMDLKVLLETNGDLQKWILLDAIDSGLSIDNIVELRELLETILTDHKNVYIVIAANSYELTRNATCIDTYTGSYIEFKDYEDYKKYILESRKTKDERL